MNQKQINNFQVILFLIMVNGFFINLIGFKYLVKVFEQNSWYIPLLFFLIYVVLLIPYKSINKTNNLLKESRSNNIIKGIIILYCFLAVLLSIFFCSVAVKDFFYNSTPIWFFILSFTLCSLYLSSKNFSTIVQIATIFLIVSLFLYIAPVINIIKRPKLNILPFKFEYKKMYLGFLVLFFPIEIFLLTFHNTHLKNGLTKKMAIINGGLTLLYISYILFDAISLIGYQYYRTLFLGGLFRWQVFSSNAVFENNDIFLLYIMSVGVVFKSAFYFNTIRLILYRKEQKKSIISIGVVFLISCYFLYSYLELIESYWQITRYILFVLMFIIFVYIIIQSRKVYKHEQ